MYLPQQCVGERLTTSFLKMKQNEAADSCGVNTPIMAGIRLPRWECTVGLRAGPAALTRADSRCAAEEGRPLVTLSWPSRWPSRWGLCSPLSPQGLTFSWLPQGLLLFAELFGRGFLLRVSMNVAQVSPNDVSGHACTHGVSTASPRTRKPQPEGAQEHSHVSLSSTLKGPFSIQAFPYALLLPSSPSSGFL